MDEVAIAVTIAANIFALVWGASRISSTVASLSAVVAKLEVALDKLAEKVSVHEVEIHVLRSRIDK